MMLMSGSQKMNIQHERSSIRSYGIKVIWRNSSTMRYLRISIDFHKWSCNVDFFRKDKLYEKLRLL